MTPSTQLLFAYNESPLLKNDSIYIIIYFVDLGGFKNLNSKKMINFDVELKENEQNMMKK